MWVIEVQFRGQDWQQWSDRTTRARALRLLRERARYEAWQEQLADELADDLGTRVIDNSDRVYRLRNEETGDLIGPERLRLMFRRSATTAAPR